VARRTFNADGLIVMGWVSRAPDVLGDLYTSAQAMQSYDCIVLQGPVVTDTGETRAVIIGWEDENTPAIEHQFAPMSAARIPLRDRFTIRCVLKALDGGGDVDAATGAVYGLFGQFLQMLEDNPFPGGVMACEVASAQLERTQVGNGMVASLLVTLACDAQTNIA
jgi:hypothetical protein